MPIARLRPPRRRTCLTPSEQKTIEELSQTVGKTTKRAVTRSRVVGRNPFEGRSVSERTEDTPLLTEDQARRMNLDEVILVIDAQMPIRARRIKYFDDLALKVLHAGQAASFPYPDEDGLRRDRQMTETRETVEKLKQELQEARAAAGAQGSGTVSSSMTVEAPATETQDPQPALSGRARGRAARAAAGGGGSGQLSVDLAEWGSRRPTGLNSQQLCRRRGRSSRSLAKDVVCDHMAENAELKT